MSDAIFKITDGTTFIDLLDTSNGFLVESWYPSLQIPKSGGIWNGSPLTDGRRLAMRHYDNAIETVNMTLTRDSHDIIIRTMQDLHRLLDKAVYYWTTSWQNEPVWIEARAKGETNIRYAVITDYRIAGLPNPFAQPFATCPPTMDELTLTLEHDYWTEKEPGTATAIAISAQQAYNGVTYGREDTTADEVFIANKHAMANITHVYWFDTSAAPPNDYSDNLIDPAGGFPVELFPAAPADRDRIYIGCDTTIADSGPFSSVIFDITTISTHFANVEWYYRSSAGGGTWAALSLTGDTINNFDTLGVGYITFVPPDLWTTVSVNTVTGYWIYGEITVAGPPILPPEQGNRNIYSAIVPFVDIESDQVPGDVPALLKAEYASASLGAHIMSWETHITDLYLGIRSLSRGEHFTPYINISNEQNQYVTVLAGTWHNLITAPSGVAHRDQRIVSDEQRIFRVQFDPTILPEYIGKYVGFLRMYVNDAGSDKIRYIGQIYDTYGGIETYSYYYTSPYFDITGTGNVEIELGIVTIPDVRGSTYELHFHIIDESASADVYFIDLILMPIDEWASKYVASWISNEELRTGDYFLIDSISYPKQYHYGQLIKSSTNYLKSELSVGAVGQSILQANSAQRLWFFAKHREYDNIYNYSTFKVLCSRGSRYLTMRGNR